ncbi:MAG TPA: EscU/YscU/HrcU family type III secretion system export apparatus switch protein [Myxococcales bacterium]
MSEKTEQPSAKRLRDARQQGNIARSRPLAAAGATLCGLLALGASLPATASDLARYAREALLQAGANATPVDNAVGRAWEVLFSACIPVLAAALLGAVAGAGLQVGVAFNPSAIGFKLEKLSPGEGFKRVFSKKNLFEVLKSALVVGVLLWLTWTTVRDAAPLAARLPGASSLALSWNAVFQLVHGLALKALGFAAAYGALDYLLERRAHLKGLMMSREDLKQEHKESEGDPHHKAKRKAAHKALLNGTVARGVQKATVVVINPTHVAVALRYAPEEAQAPTIVAKGVEDEAAKIRFLARQFKVPMVRDVPLARTLVRYDLGEEVPEELYLAAAAVLNKVFEMGAAVPASNPDSDSSPSPSPRSSP